MILRRFSDALRKQDWFSIVIETLIVIFGVFIGLQVNNWNEARVENAAQASLLQRLKIDFSENEPTVQAATERLSLAAKQTGMLIDYLRAGDDPPDDKDILLIVEAPSRVGTMPPVTATYQEMLSTGGLSRISNQELRTALVRYGQNAEKFQLLLAKTLDVMMNSPASQTHAAAIQMSTDWSIPDDQSIVISFDWQKLQAAESHIYAIFIEQNILRLLAETQLAEVRNILVLLEAETQ